VAAVSPPHPDYKPGLARAAGHATARAAVPAGVKQCAGREQPARRQATHARRKATQAGGRADLQHCKHAAQRPGVQVLQPDICAGTRHCRGLGVRELAWRRQSREGGHPAGRRCPRSCRRGSSPCPGARSRPRSSTLSACRRGGHLRHRQAAVGALARGHSSSAAAAPLRVRSALLYVLVDDDHGHRPPQAVVALQEGLFLVQLSTDLLLRRRAAPALSQSGQVCGSEAGCSPARRRTSSTRPCGR